MELPTSSPTSTFQLAVSGTISDETVREVNANAPHIEARIKTRREIGAAERTT
jgi:hypothetical protein